MEALPDQPIIQQRQSLLRMVHDRNPFYLLSALSMFAGFRIVLASLDAKPGDWKPLVGLIATLQVYQWLIVGLAVALIRGRGLLRDGWILLGIDALFTADLTNLNAELFTALPRLGLLVSGGCLAMAVLKIAVVLRTLRIRITAGTGLYVVTALSALFGLPGVFRLTQSPEAAVSPGRIYAVWWAVAVLIVVGAWIVRRSMDRNPMSPLPWRLYVLVPLVSLLVHLAGENRTYWVHFEPANLAPVLLAGLVVWHRTRRDLTVGFAVAISAFAIALSMTDRTGVLADRWLGVGVSPMRLTLLVTAMVLIPVAIRHQSILLAALMTGGVAVAALGSSASQITGRLSTAAQWAFDSAGRLVPQTGVQWGEAAIALSFALLATGAAVSFRKPRDSSEVA